MVTWPWPRPQRHADADFLSPLAHRVGDHAVDAGGGEQGRQRGERCQQLHHQTTLRKSPGRHLFHGSNKRYGLVGINLPYFALDCACQAQGVARGADHQVHHPGRILLIGKIEDRRTFFPESVSADRADHADYRNPGGLQVGVPGALRVERVEPEPLSNRLLARPIAPGQLFINHCDGGGFG